MLVEPRGVVNTGEAEGETRAITAAETAISNPLLDDITMRGARGVLINITGGPDMTLFEVDEAANRIREEVDNEANIVFGSTFDEAMEGLLRVSVVATGIEAEAATAPRSLPSGLSTLTPRTERREPSVSELVDVNALATEGRSTSDDDAALPQVEAGKSEIHSSDASGLETEEDEPEALLLDEMLVEAEPDVPLETPQSVSEQTVTSSSGVAALDTAPTELLSDTNDEPSLSKEKPQLMQRRRAPFIPPKPVAAEQTVGDVEPEPFAAAAMENARNEIQESHRERRRPSLFERMTGAGRQTQKEQPESRKLGESEPKTPLVETGNATNLEASVGAEPAERFQLSQAEEEMLDIPAFLRRQAN